MINVKEVHLSPEELEKCMEFSRTSAPNQQAIEFGQSSTKPRSTCEISRDNLIGKIAEVAFSKIMKENYGITVPLDFNYYPRGQWDNQDAAVNGWRIDVKGTRRGGHWMLIEWNKLNFRQREGKLSHIFVMFSVDWDRDRDCPTGTVCFEGIASLQKLRNNVENTLILRKGTLIPGTKARLQADNYGIHFRNLYHDFDGFVKFVTEQMPPDALTDEYPNPYTGEVIREHKIQYSVREKQIPAEAEESSEQPAKVSKLSFAAAIRDWIRQKIHF